MHDPTKIRSHINEAFTKMKKEDIAQPAIAEMDKAVKCLALELPSSVWDDVNARWQAVRQLAGRLYVGV